MGAKLGAFDWLINYSRLANGNPCSTFGGASWSTPFQASSLCCDGLNFELTPTIFLKCEEVAQKEKTPT